MYAGVGAQRVRDLFRRARDLARREKRKGAIIFIDEIEVLGGRRGQHSSHLEYDQTLNQLLTEMDGISSDAEVTVLVVGATNRVDMLDPALLRPGRFDRIVNVDLPDKSGRLQILQLHVRGKPLADGVDLEAIAAETFGFSGAHLEGLCNEAAILALRQGKSLVEQSHFVEAVDKVILGEKMDRRPIPEEKRRIAVHEAGHAVVGEWLRPGSVASVTVTPRGRAMGYVRSRQEDHYLYTRRQLEELMKIALAGAVAEETLLGDRSTGAQGDLEQVLQLARQIVTSGLSDLGVVDPHSLGDAALHEATAALVRSQEEAVGEMLRERAALLEQVAAMLEDKEALSGDELRELMMAAVA